MELDKENDSEKELKKVSYYCSDFDFHDYVETVKLHKLINCTADCDIDDYEGSWNHFYQLHSSGKIYKPRKYLIPEFQDFLFLPSIDCILEVGCGYGCTMFPVLEALSKRDRKEPLRYIATDISVEALQILKNHPLYSKYDSQIISTAWNIAQVSFLDTFAVEHDVDAIFSIFTLSAVRPQEHHECFMRFKELLSHNTRNPPDLPKTKYIFFRDYGVYDFTMLDKHQIRHGEFLYRRLDGTYCFYFSLEYLRGLVESLGMRVVELSYATVINYNRKTKEKMYRIFIHGVFAVDILNLSVDRDRPV